MNTKKATKRALLTSVMALVMCVVMLVGTTFAWFTDTASTGVNRIVAGNLKVDIVGAKMVNDEYPSLTGEGSELSFTKAGTEVGTDAATAILWEPGCRYVTEGFRIANKGNLALKWKAQVNKGTTVKNDGGFDLLDVIDFYIVKSNEENAPAVAIEDFTGNLAANTTSEDVYYIKGVMKTTAGNDYQGLTLDGITITVVATQDTVESDSFGPDYDEGAMYPAMVNSLESVNNAIASGNAYIYINEDFTVDVNKNGGWTALYFSKDKTPNMAEQIVLDGNGTVKSTKYAIWANRGADIVINGGTYDNNTEENKYGEQLIYANKDARITINGGTFIMAEIEGGLMFNISNQAASLGGTIIIKGGLFNQKPESGTAWQIQDNWDEATGTGIKVAEGYTIKEETIDGATWYRVVAE